MDNLQLSINLKTRGLKTLYSKIDVIVPVYNNEQYLEQCLDSIITQTLHEIRVICVNDGSTDRSSEILQKYARMDDRVCVIEQENKGYGAAVNMGLSVAQAQYIVIVESDDFIDPFCFQALLNLASVCGGVDIAKCAYNEYYDVPNGTHEIKPSLSSTVETHLFPFKIAQYPELLIYHPSIWSAICRRAFLKENQLRLVEAPGAAWTDNPFFIATMCCAEKIVWSQERHYYYRKTNPNSSSILHDCSIPLLRAMDMLDIIETEPLKDLTIFHAVYKRCLNYIQIVTENPAYQASKDDVLIRKIVSRIPYSEICGEYFTIQERAMHRIFSRLVLEW